ncbi:voltage-dependent calcium channel gamma-1 subunit isoform X1 [Sus scrofa]|uniref:voltage-dependent calcium channel gamma-1 subunit isoform X1 n=1 Tax=Sus scrofa TaxID=9823 RepID=UPI000A2B1B55|nr:voltage-dependent calcium channel gamma-1 subunit isoform X1 [Sus scrofa]
MSQTKALKVRVTLFCILVGIVLALVAVVTDHWAVLSPHVEHLNATCEAAHFGLWRICTKRIAVGDSKDKSCGPITLPGEKNCSYFRHFNPGETSEIFHVTTQKEYSISAAAIAIFSLGFIILGTICGLLSFRKKRDYLLRPASMFYAFAVPPLLPFSASTGDAPRGPITSANRIYAFKNHHQIHLRW